MSCPICGANCRCKNRGAGGICCSCHRHKVRRILVADSPSLDATTRAAVELHREWMRCTFCHAPDGTHKESCPLAGPGKGAPEQRKLLDQPRSLDEYRAMCTVTKCKWCGTHLPSTIMHYPHPGGYRVMGIDGLQWLYVQCVNCEYEFALWKLGVPRWFEEQQPEAASV